MGQAPNSNPNPALNQQQAADLQRAADSMAASQAFSMELMLLQNDHQTKMQGIQAQKQAYQQVRA